MDGNPSVSEQTASEILSYDASTAGASPKGTTDTLASIRNVSVIDESAPIKDMTQETPAPVTSILPNGRDTALHKSTRPNLSSQQVDPETLRAPVAHLQSLNDFQKRQKEALNRDLTAMENWGLGQENRAESAER